MNKSQFPVYACVDDKTNTFNNISTVGSDVMLATTPILSIPNSELPLSNAQYASLDTPVRRKIFIHLGMQKTGSTFIQRAMRQHFSQNIVGGVLYYPADDIQRTSEGYGSGNLEGIANVCLGVWTPMDYRSELAFENLSKVLRDAKSDIFFSSESFFSAESLNKELVNQFVSKVNTGEFDVKFIVFVRDPIDLAISCWLQGVKRHFTNIIDVDNYVSNFRLNFSVVLDAFNIDENSQALIVINYDKVKSNIFGALMERLEIPFSGTIKNIIVNRSLSSLETKVMEEITKVCDDIGLSPGLRNQLKTMVTDRFEQRNMFPWKPQILPCSIEKFKKNNFTDILKINQLISCDILKEKVHKEIPVSIDEAEAVTKDLSRELSELFLSFPQPKNLIPSIGMPAEFFCGYKEVVWDRYLHGWAYCKTSPENSVIVEARTINERFLAVANVYRPDVKPIDTNRPMYCGFIIELSVDKVTGKIPRLEELEVFIFGTEFQLPSTIR